MTNVKECSPGRRKMIPDKILAFHTGMKSSGSGILFTLNMKHVTSYLVGLFLLPWA